MPPPSHEDDELLGPSRDYILCDNEDCGKPGARKRCSGCKSAFYCDPVCQKNHWRVEHRTLCKLIQKQNAQWSIAMTADHEEAAAAAAAAPAPDEDACAICLESPPKVPIPLACSHQFCYECLGELHSVAIRSGTMTVENMPCPLCRAPSIPLDIFSCLLDAAAVYTRRAERIRSYKYKYGLNANTMRAEALALAEGKLEEALTAGVNVETGARDPFFHNVMYMRAQNAVSTGDYVKAIALMLDSTTSYGSPEGDFHVQLKQEGGRGNYCEHLLLLAVSYVKATQYEKAIPVLQKCMTEMGNWKRNGKMERELFARYAQSMHGVAEYEKAIDMGSAAIEMNRTYENSHKYVALSQQARGDLEGAIETMRQAVVYETPWDHDNIEANRAILSELLAEKESDGGGGGDGGGVAVHQPDTAADAAQ